MTTAKPGHDDAQPRVTEQEVTAAARRAADSLRSPEGTAHVNLDPDNPRNGVAQLVLTLIKFLHELLSRQAVRRMDAGTLTDEEIERLGLALMKQAAELDRLRREFGLDEEDLNLDLGPLGRLV